MATVRVTSRDKFPLDVRVHARTLTQLEFAKREIQEWASKHSASELLDLLEDDISMAITSTARVA